MIGDNVAAVLISEASTVELFDGDVGATIVQVELSVAAEVFVEVPTLVVSANGGGGTGISLFVQNAAPVDPPSKYVWFQTGLGGGSDMTLWIEDGS